MFLAMLELVRLQAVLLHQPLVLGDILIKKADNFDQVMVEQARRGTTGVRRPRIFADRHGFSRTACGGC